MPGNDTFQPTVVLAGEVHTCVGPAFGAADNNDAFAQSYVVSRLVS